MKNLGVARVGVVREVPVVKPNSGVSPLQLEPFSRPAVHFKSFEPARAFSRRFHHLKAILDQLCVHCVQSVPMCAHCGPIVFLIFSVDRMNDFRNFDVDGSEVHCGMKSARVLPSVSFSRVEVDQVGALDQLPSALLQDGAHLSRIVDLWKAIWKKASGDDLGWISNKSLAAKAERWHLDSTLNAQTPFKSHQI